MRSTVTSNQAMKIFVFVCSNPFLLSRSYNGATKVKYNYYILKRKVHMVTRTNDYTGVGLLVVIDPFQEISRI